MEDLQFSDRILARHSGGLGLASERRDTELAITLWHQKASELGTPPPFEAFDFTRLTIDWSYRFIICGDDAAHSVFLLYGVQFARLLQLPERPNYYDPLIVQLPTRYRALFTEGCEAACSEAAAAKFSGAVAHHGCTELYRAAFLPMRLRLSELRPLVFGSFNYRAIERVPERWQKQSG